MDTRISKASDVARTIEIGSFNEPILVCGGAYSNLEALSALLEKARALSIPPSRIIHTGDAIAYCADPSATAALLRESGVHCIQGNVEESLSACLPDCGCGFSENSLCKRLAAEWFAFADARIGDDLRRWMGKLPQHLTLTLAGKTVRVVHGSATSVNRFMFASQPDVEFDAELDAADAELVIAGHSGIPFTRRVGARYWHNSGPLGLPANDGTPRVWFSILQPEGDTIRMRHCAMDYDYKAANEKMRSAGVCAEYAETLITGLWPSLDILPLAERERTGMSIDLEEDIVWETAETVV